MDVFRRVELVTAVDLKLVDQHLLLVAARLVVAPKEQERNAFKFCCTCPLLEASNELEQGALSFGAGQFREVDEALELHAGVGVALALLSDVAEVAMLKQNINKSMIHEQSIAEQNKNKM